MEFLCPYSVVSSHLIYIVSIIWKLCSVLVVQSLSAVGGCSIGVGQEEKEVRIMKSCPLLEPANCLCGWESTDIPPTNDGKNSGGVELILWEVSTVGDGNSFD